MTLATKSTRYDRVCGVPSPTTCDGRGTTQRRRRQRVPNVFAEVEPEPAVVPSFIADRVSLLADLLAGVVDEDTDAAGTLVRLLVDAHHLCVADSIDLRHLLRLAADRAAVEQSEERETSGRSGGLGDGLAARLYGLGE